MSLPSPTACFLEQSNINFDSKLFNAFMHMRRLDLSI